MYTPPVFKEERLGVLHALMRERPLAAVVIAHEGGFEVGHVPFLLAEDAPPPGTLHAHVSRANALWTLAGAGVRAVAIFQAEQGYISPSWYPAKAETGRVVPTWNYVVAHAHGVLRAIDDADWVRTQASALADRHEAGRAAPWSLADAPPDYTAAQLRGIVGLELRVDRLEGKWKLGQNRSRADRAGAIEGLAAEADAAAGALAERMRREMDGG